MPAGVTDTHRRGIRVDPLVPNTSTHAALLDRGKARYFMNITLRATTFNHLGNRSLVASVEKIRPPESHQGRFAVTCASVSHEGC